MPELPEVEVVCRSLRPLACGQRLVSVWTSGKALRSFSGAVDALAPLVGQSLLGLGRRAKYLVFDFERHGVFMHLGMSGVADWTQASSDRPRHCHLEWAFESGVLRLIDPRRFGDVQLVSLGAGERAAGLTAEAGLEARLGLEPLGPDFSGECLYIASRGVRQAVKVWLMRGDPVVGVGNIYASEALFRAGIHPSRAAGRISAARYDRLAQTIVAVLSEAIEAGGSTLRDFRGVAGELGRYGGEHRVYGRAGESCVACGAPVRRTVQAQRATYFCGHCQR